MKTVSGGKGQAMLMGAIGLIVVDILSLLCGRGLRQGDSMSPLQFDLAVDILAILCDRAVEHGFISGLARNHKDNDVSILQYADDTIILFEGDV